MVKTKEKRAIFTAGPWHRGFKDDQVIYSEHKQVAIIQCREKEWEANARLISAAPQLLESVKLIKAFFDEMPKGQLGNVVCDIGLLNDFFISSAKAINQVEGKS